MESNLSSTENYSKIVSSVMEIVDVTWGDPKQNYLVRFRGNLKLKINDAQRRLTTEFRHQKIGVIISQESLQTTIFLINDPYSNIVSEIFNINDVNFGGEKDGYLVRYKGELNRESVGAYDFLSDRLKSQDITPLFRVENGIQTIILISGINRPSRSNPIYNLLFFIATILSVAFVGSLSSIDSPDISFSLIIKNLWKGWPFAVSLLSILLAHEFGHYIAGRIHKTAVTLPYFIPLPLPPFGTLGAFIQLKSPPKNKRVLHDIGVAGPLAGLVVAVPVLIFGLALSQIDSLPSSIQSGGPGLQLEGNSLLYLGAKYLVFGEMLPSPSSFGGGSPLWYWIKYFFTGQPVPFGGRDVLIHPVALAGWGGLLVTSLNLIPAGQLDGGHVIYVLIGRRARRLLPLILIVLFGLGLIWSGWWLWAFLISFFGRTYAEPLDQITELDSTRKAIAIFSLLIFFLVFTPVPLNILLPP